MAEHFFQLTREQGVDVVALALPRSMQSDEFDRLNEEMLEVFGGQPQGRWVLDLSAVHYMGSSALGLMVNIRQRIKQAGGTLALCGLNPNLLQIFHTCCMERLFTIVRSRADALRIVAA